MSNSQEMSRRAILQGATTVGVMATGAVAVGQGAAYANGAMDGGFQSGSESGSESGFQSGMQSGMDYGTLSHTPNGAINGLLGGASGQDKFPLLFQPSQTRFPRDFWSPELRARVVVGELMARNWASVKAPTPPHFDDLEAMRGEIKQMIDLQAKRPERQGEILEQSGNLTPTWGRLLTADAGRRPATAALIQVCFQFGSQVSLYWKMAYAMPRPAMVYPALTPIVATPPHPAYPSGHALQSHLVRYLMAEALRSRAVTSPAPQPLTAEGLEGVLKAMAERIAENREIAGVHYPADSQASEKLAKNLVAWIGEGLSAPSNPFAELKTLFAEIREEWQGAAKTLSPNQMAPVASFADQVAEAVARKIKAT